MKVEIPPNPPVTAVLAAYRNVPSRLTESPPGLKAPNPALAAIPETTRGAVSCPKKAPTHLGMRLQY